MSPPSPHQAHHLPSLAEGGEGLGTLGLPEPVLRQLAGKAGFCDVRHVEMDNPFNSLYELTR